MMGLPGGEKSLVVGLAISIQYTNVTDGRTDGHRSTAKTALCIASSGIASADQSPLPRL